MDQTETLELEQTIGAHDAWLDEKGIKVEGDRWGLSAREALTGVESAGLHLNERDRKIAMAVLASRMLLLRFFTRAVGVSRIGIQIEQRLKENLEAEADPDAKGRMKLERAAVRELHDHGVEDAVERKARLLTSHIRSFMRAIDGRSKRAGARYAAMREAGLAEAAAPGLARSRSEDVWMKALLQSTISEIEWYTSQLRGASSSAPLGFSGPPDSKAWHKVRGAGLLLIQEGGGPASLQRRLFPSLNPDPAREKQRNEKRRARARARTNSDT